jgi:hypothetical protein
MKDNRTFINEYDGWPGRAVNFLSTYSNGATQKNTCSKDEWDAYLLKVKLVQAGADESLVDEFYSIAYSIGYDEGSIPNEDY